MLCEDSRTRDNDMKFVKNRMDMTPGNISSVKEFKYIYIYIYIYLYIRGSFHKQVTKRHHSVNFQNMKIRKYTFCREFNWGHILEFLEFLR